MAAASPPTLPQSASGYHASDGAAYQVFLGRWTVQLAKAFADFARLPGNGDTLDVGCGTGSLAAELAQRDSHRAVVGIDLSEPYIFYAAEHSAFANLSFRQGDAAALPFPDDAFGGALAQLVLTFVPDAGRVAAEMARVVRPGGIVAAAVWDFGGGLVYQRIFWDTAAVLDPDAGRERDRLFAHPLSQPEALVGLWRSAGLIDVEIGSLTVRMDYASFADYWDPLLGGQGPVGAFAASLDMERRDRVRSAVREAYLSGRPNGPRSLTATAWAVRGIKASGGHR